MPLAIQAIERYGRTKAFSFTHYLNLLPQTEQTIGWVIAELQRDFQGLPEEQYFYFLNLSRLLCHADIRLVAQRAVEIHQAPHFDAKELPAFRERLELFGWNAEKSWQALQQYCEANKDKNNIEEFDLGHALRIVEALAQQPHEYQGQVVAVPAQKVHDFRHDARKWLQPLMAKLAGRCDCKQPFRRSSATSAMGQRVAQDAGVSESVLLGHYVKPKLWRKSNRTFYRIQASLPPEVASRYGHQETPVAALERKLEAARADKDWPLVAELAVRLAKERQPDAG